MLPTKPVIVIIGAGAVGGYYGGRLAQHGQDVHFLLRSEYETVLRAGWSIQSCDGDFTIHPDPAHLHRDPQTLPPADLIVITMKATSNHAFPSLITPALKDSTLILTLQNGLGNEEQLAALFGPQRILGGLAFVCLNRTSPGRIHHIDHGHIRVGPFLEPQRPLAEQVVALFASSGIRCQSLPSLMYGRWEKLTWNVPFSGLGAVMQLSTDRLLASPAGLSLIRAIGAEVLAAAKANGVNLPPDMIEEKISQTATMGAYKSSMQIDRELGRAMETEAILGEPVRAAERAGLPVPSMRMLYELATLVNLGRS